MQTGDGLTVAGEKAAAGRADGHGDMGATPRKPYYPKTLGQAAGVALLFHSSYVRGVR